MTSKQLAHSCFLFSEGIQTESTRLWGGMAKETTPVLIAPKSLVGDKNLPPTPHHDAY
jgi:hypothetical protein